MPEIDAELELTELELLEEFIVETELDLVSEDIEDEIEFAAVDELDKDSVEVSELKELIFDKVIVLELYPVISGSLSHEFKIRENSIIITIVIATYNINGLSE